MIIKFLDLKSIGEDLDLSGFRALGEVVTYSYTSAQDAPERIRDADIIILNKVPINRKTLGEPERLKMVCMTGTGVNHIDTAYLEERGIRWCNVEDYCTDSVAQHTFAILFSLLENLSFYDRYVKGGTYVGDRAFTHFTNTFHELKGKTWGILGLGNIGRRVAEIATAFGANVIYTSMSGRPPQEGYRQVDFEALLTESDILSVHAPLNEHTRNCMNRDAFRRMKRDAIFLNLGRGQIVVEEDLRDALLAGEILAAGLDVLCEEPMSEACPLYELIRDVSTSEGTSSVREVLTDNSFAICRDHRYADDASDSGSECGLQENTAEKHFDRNRLLITPHIGWASLEARKRVLDVLLEKIKKAGIY